MADEEKAPPLSIAMKIRPRPDAESFHVLYIEEQALQIFGVFGCH
ncbi:MAG: hypothetical protein XD54_1272 [Thermococcus sibiricus]|uniref:Uncharacterized protein n=1 Tax=Thermococcus sibiricus TaxID=172049 RepID=A0A101ELP0_9EURY|nr:MAG: hypothetical protein XD54_1272 [Thermococcus sibiricus]KUK28865.1 MAG: hypothetical protein XD61_0611 [Thermococcus sp. 40_45]